MMLPWRRGRPLGVALLALAVAPAPAEPGAVAPAPAAPEAVILLHGLGRTHRSMRPMEAALREAGFFVVNESYASNRAPIDRLADDSVGDAIAACRTNGARRIHFVTHSLGGILVRLYVLRHPFPDLGRVVMLSPPNQGSEVVDTLRSNTLFRTATGPAGQVLGTDSNSLPARLPAVDFELGVIAGDRSLDPWFSPLIPGLDDGKVAVDRTRVDGMRDFLVVHASHPFIMRTDEVIRQTLHFLRNGRFAPETPEDPK